MPTDTAADAPAWVPDLVSWNTTQRCNLSCSHCYLAAGQRGDDELSTEESLEVVDRLADAGTRMLILTGGEPLMRRDIGELAARAAARGMLAVLGTNGMLITQSRARRLKADGFSGVAISLDSARPELHDEFRGVPGAWRGAMRGVRACVAEELPVLIQMTVLPWNIDEVEDLIELAHREGATGFNLYFLVCTGRGEKLSDITPAQYEQVLDILTSAQERYPQMMVRARCAPQISRLAAQRGSALVGNAGCMAAKQYCRITPDGRVTPCPYLPLTAGSLREQTFAEIWDGAELFAALRRGATSGKCADCGFHDLCGGCRARSFALTGDLSGEDPWCGYESSDPPVLADDAPIRWAPEAEQRLEHIPAFIRERVRGAVERRAREEGLTEITGAEMTATFEALGRRLPFRRLPGHPADIPRRQQPVEASRR